MGDLLVREPDGALREPTRDDVVAWLRAEHEKTAPPPRPVLPLCEPPEFLDVLWTAEYDGWTPGPTRSRDAFAKPRTRRQKTAALTRAHEWTEAVILDALDVRKRGLDLAHGARGRWLDLHNRVLAAKHGSEP